MSQEKSTHNAAKLVAEVGAAGLGAAAVGGAVTYIIKRRTSVRKEREEAVDPELAPMYEERLAILDEPNIAPPVRHVMALLAMKVHHASTEAGEMVISKKGLVEGLDISGRDFSDAMGHLRDNKLVGMAPRISNPRSYGFFELPALKWAMQQDNPPMALLEAESEFLRDQF
jgi:hypothetical protein